MKRAQRGREPLNLPNGGAGHLANSVGVSFRMTRADACVRWILVRRRGRVFRIRDGFPAHFFVFDRAGRTLLDKPLTRREQRSDGALPVALSPADLRGLEPADYGLELTVCTPGGTRFTALRGVLRLTE